MTRFIDPFNHGFCFDLQRSLQFTGHSLLAYSLIHSLIVHFNILLRMFDAICLSQINRLMNSINNDFALIYNTCNQSLLLLEIIYLRAYSLIHSSLFLQYFFTSSALVGSTTNSVLIYNTWNRSLQYTGSSLLAYIRSYILFPVICTFSVRSPLMPDFFDFQRLKSIFLLHGKLFLVFFH